MRTLTATVVLSFASTSVWAGGSTSVNPWMPVIGNVVLLALQVLGPILVVLTSWAAWRLAKKLGIEKSAVIDSVLRSYVKEAINWADVWARQQTGKPAGEQKKAAAVKYILDLLQQSAFPKIAAERLQSLIEAQLIYDKKALSNADLNADSAKKAING